MNLDHAGSWQPHIGSGTDTKEWRYSTAPQDLAALSTDVREPLPSPTLPHVPMIESSSMDKIAEPVSSGFASPAMQQLGPSTTGDITPAKPRTESPISDPVQTLGSLSGTRVGRDLRRLRVSSDRSNDTASEDASAERLSASHPRSQADARSMQVSPVTGIYISESAEAAAESAKAKRRWLRGIYPEDMLDDDETGPDEAEFDMAAGVPNLQMMYPDPIIHQLVRPTPCPNPSLHDRSPPVYRRPVDDYDTDMVFADHEPHHGISSLPGIISHRATATGSPMPCTRLRSRPTMAHSERYTFDSPTQQSTRARIAAVNEHFQPGWYYASEPVLPSPSPNYSFSTAASKAIGSDQAPDSRMRDSYKTDTLTALPVSTTRYRKTGIGAHTRTRDISRYYERPSSAASARVAGFRPRPSSRQTCVSSSEVRFRSSPPPPLVEDRILPVRRKRAVDDSFVIAEDMYRPASITPDLRRSEMNGRTQSNEGMDVAVRTSVFGGSTPEALRSARHGIQELSPNVQLYRKATQGNMHLRKKRRPSYWDNDLKEVRESPAGRGGVQSAVSAQESMRAEFEVASSRDTEMEYEEDC